MDIRFYNTLTHQIESFVPQHPGQVTMYNCGPTVYDYAHIGNFRAFVFADLLRRFLESAGYFVHQAMNITDVGHMTDDANADGAGEDKMQLAARRLKEAKKSGTLPPNSLQNPDDPYQVAAYYTQAFLEDARALGLKIAAVSSADAAASSPPQPNMPRATQYISQMQQLISTLLAKKHAYIAGDGCVYFDVQSFPAYGQLSGNSLDRLRAGAGGRVEEHQLSSKKHPADFLLWKPDPSHLMKWPFPQLGPNAVGYPGWHIECSAMSLTVLSQLTGQNLQTIDIHTGGEDNIFPHHECEIAQSCGATGQPHFARFWMHTRFLLVDGRKMSKSKGNFYTVRDVLEGRAAGRPVTPAVLRLALLRAHYRSNMDFTIRGLEDSAAMVQRLRNLDRQLIQSCIQQSTTSQSSPVLLTQTIAQHLQDPQIKTHPVITQWMAALADDLNIAGALAVLFTWLNESDNKQLHPYQSLAVLRTVDQMLGVLPPLETVIHEMASPQAPVLSPAASATAFISADAEFSDALVPNICLQIDQARKDKNFALADQLRKTLIEHHYDVQTTKQGTTAQKKLM